MTKDKFLSDIVFGWIKRDLERMTKEVPAKDGEVGNINFPLASCTLDYMQFLGSFLLGKDAGVSDNISKYLELCLAKHKTEYPVDLLADIFRNGLSHDYFARGGISRDGRRPAMYKNPTVGPVLDVETLVSDFLGSLDTFRAVLAAKEFSSRVNQVLDAVKNLQTKHKNLIDALPTTQVSLTSSVQITPSSGASGYHGPITPTQTTVTPGLPYPGTIPNSYHGPVTTTQTTTSGVNTTGNPAIVGNTTSNI